MERDYRKRIEDLDLEFQKFSDSKRHDLKMMWQRRHDWEKAQWEDMMEKMREREKYLCTEDDVWLDEEIANKLNAEILVATGKMALDINKADNEVQRKITSLKDETIKADRDYLNAMDEIDKLKEKLRKQRMNTDIRYKYVYQNLMGDKIDLLNKRPPIPISLPP